ncbi:hypothetical protein GCM10015535_32200 [Streptomyces gelaticus]|uniref:Uncharacterized protein n=1 Tax=Streptomyces gelaticus TaxID=285446 RepID=A0ABQ2VZN8_9ACTN|nr:hypothetical protein [Streptomyces gelaticus]GGV85507.1 hypothetical protein GCM10015535_32200 [Streptomyces gelaticus]
MDPMHGTVGVAPTRCGCRRSSTTSTTIPVSIQTPTTGPAYETGALSSETKSKAGIPATDSGRLPPANAAPAGIEAATAAAGGIAVMLWKRTSRSPMASRNSPLLESPDIPRSLCVR